MIISYFLQDTIKQKITVRQDTLKLLPDSSTVKVPGTPDSLRPAKTVKPEPQVLIQNSDTISACYRNSTADITFFDSTNIIHRIDGRCLQDFPFVFAGINKKNSEAEKAEIIQHLKYGEKFPTDHYQNDWVLPVIIVSLFIFGVIKAESGKFFEALVKFITFRGINEPSSRDTGILFQWQSTLFNLASFINISIFAFFTARWFNFIPADGKNFLYWLISLSIILAAVTVRHLVCSITGNASGEKEIFREYLVGIYQAYRLSGLLLIVVTIMILYTTFLPENFLFYTGFCVIGLSYFIRVSRLFLIFINRHVSIFYLILYLCALEILPVVIIIKYVTGLV